MAFVLVPPTVQQVKAEIDADPLGLGYAAMETAQNWNGIVDALNLVRATQVINRRHVFAVELIEAIEAAAINGLNVGNRDAIVFLMQAAGNGVDIDPFNTVTRTYFNLFGGATKTRLDTLLTRPGSRAEFLWGDGAAVGDSIVEAACRLP
jgi:hypothetical protein